MDWGWGMRAMLTIVCLSSMAVASYAQSQGEFHTQPSQVKRTVDALVGHWSFKGSDAEPGVKESLNVSMEIDCRLAVLGTAVACTLRGKIANSGPIEAATIVGYDPDEQTVHWMEISSTGEYHDHKGKWKGEMIVFEPPQVKLGGFFGVVMEPEEWRKLVHGWHGTSHEVTSGKPTSCPVMTSGFALNPAPSIRVTERLEASTQLLQTPMFLPTPLR